MKKILIIGAGFLQDFVIRKARELGYFTIAIDGNPDAVGFIHADKYEVIDITDEEACYQYAKKEKINGVITASTDYGVLSASYVAERLGLIGIPYYAAKRIKNKYLVRKTLVENCVDDSNLSYLIDENTNFEELKSVINFPVIVKPCDGSGSRGTTRVDKFIDFEDACIVAMSSSLSKKAEVEEFIDGEEYGVESFVTNGEVRVLGVMKKWMTRPPHYAELGHAIPSGLSLSIENKVKDCAIKAIKALGLNSGSVNMDVLVTTEGKVHIIDIGARMGGNLIGPCIIPYGMGVSYVENAIKSAVGDEIDWSINKHKFVATRILAFDEGIVKQLPNFDEVEKIFDVEIYHHMNIGDFVNDYRTNLDGCGYIVSSNENFEKAVENAVNALKYIKNYIFK